MKKLIPIFFILFSLSLKAQWQQLKNPLAYNSVTALAFSGDTLYAAIKSNGIYKSTDWGNTWNQVFVNTSFDSTVDVFAIIGSNIIAGTFNGGIILSSNYGKTWTRNFGGAPAGIPALAINGTKIFAGGGSGVYLSTNNGKTWVSESTGLPNGAKALAVNGTTIYAGISGNNGGVYLTTNNGTSWGAAPNGLGLVTQPVKTIDALAVVGTNVFAVLDGVGIYITKNGGVSWSQVSSSISSSHIMAVSNSSVITCGDYGVIVSSNMGGTWNKENGGLTNSSIYSFASKKNIFFAGSATNGIFKTDSMHFFNPISSNFSSITDVSCNNGNNGKATATASGGIAPYSYTWSTIPMQISSIATNLTAGTYTVSITDNSGYTSTASITITEPLPTTASITVNGKTTICQGDSVKLTANTASTYSWSTGEKTQNIMVSKAENYYLSITDANGCSASSTPTSISVDNGPKTSFSNIPSCSKNSTFISATGGNSYLWTPGNFQTDTITVSSITKTIYLLEAKDSLGCPTFIKDTVMPNTNYIVINQQPKNQTVQINSTVFFYVTSNQNKIFHWQSNQFNSNTFSDLTNSGTYNGVNTDSLTIFGANTQMNNVQFRCLIYNNTCIDSSYAAMLIVNNTTGINEHITKEIVMNIYPNPSSGKLILETNSPEKKEMNIFDITGKLILSSVVFDKETIDLSNFGNGIFNLSLRTGTDFTNKRFVIFK